jgi:hypothetical protein
MSPCWQSRNVPFFLGLGGVHVNLRVPVKRKTGNAGEQPDRGIAGRNSSADDEKERDPPGAFFYLGVGPTSGRRSGPASGFGFGFAFGNPIGPDRFRHALKTHTEAPQY